MIDAEIELEYDERYDELMWRSRDHKHILVGYLTADQCCENPLENCDSMGKIVDKKDAGHHLGFVDNEPDLEPHFAYIARLAGNVDSQMIFTPEQQVAATQMWLTNYKAFKTPSTWARALHERFPGVQECDDNDILKGHTTRAWVPDKALYDHINSQPPKKRDAVAYRCFLNAIEEYNRWADGDCYGVIVEHFIKKSCGHYHPAGQDTDHQCWGYVGHKWALQDLKTNFKLYKEKIKKKS